MIEMEGAREMDGIHTRIEIEIEIAADGAVMSGMTIEGGPKAIVIVEVLGVIRATATKAPITEGRGTSVTKALATRDISSERTATRAVTIVGETMMTAVATRAKVLRAGMDTKETTQQQPETKQQLMR